MATITGLTAERMQRIEGQSVIDGDIVGGYLMLTKFDGTTINAGVVVGPTGPQGPQGLPGISSIPGEFKGWPGTSLPAQATYGKWVWADGAIYAAATYPIAASHINPAWKTAYGQADPGVGNFRVPDFRGLVLAGLDAMPGGSRANRMTRSVAITIAGKTGEETHILTISELAPHTHTYWTEAVKVGSTSGFAYSGGGSDKLPQYVKTGNQGDVPPNPASAGVNEPTSGGVAHENVQPTVFVPYIVRLDG